MKPEETLDFHLRWAWHNIARIYNAEAARHGITMSTGFVLLSIDQKDGTPSTKLGPKMGMEPRSLTRTLKSMEEENLIHRKNDKSDKRSVRIFLTEKGKKKREIARSKVVYFNETLQKKLGKKNVNEFFKTMSDLNGMLEHFEFEK
ncbi:MAG TPA: MarR family transcriptional regulator [Flavobacteriales bacterium]|nr:MarR family transcriptional regulator [Flavobacteriales bacterium]